MKREFFFKTEMAGSIGVKGRMTKGVWSCIFSISFQPVSKLNNCPDECEKKTNSIGIAITFQCPAHFSPPYTAIKNSSNSYFHLECLGQYCVEGVAEKQKKIGLGVRT